MGFYDGYTDIIKGIEKQEESLNKMKPIFERLDEIFKPEGQFEKLVGVVHENSIKVKSHDMLIKGLGSIVIGIVIVLIIAIANLIH